jgi:hypothetical protein
MARVMPFLSSARQDNKGWHPSFNKEDILFTSSGLQINIWH